jgi:hypothetical protein
MACLEQDRQELELLMEMKELHKKEINSTSAQIDSLKAENQSLKDKNHAF